jgi:hypothetical protein
VHACHCKRHTGGDCDCRVKRDKLTVIYAIEELDGATLGELTFHLTNDIEEVYLIYLLRELYLDGVTSVWEGSEDIFV